MNDGGWSSKVARGCNGVARGLYPRTEFPRGRGPVSLPDYPLVSDDNRLLDIRIQKLVEQKGAAVRIRARPPRAGTTAAREVQRQAALPAPLAESGPEA